MTRNTFAALFLVGTLACLTTGCSGDEDYIFEHGPAGPNTENTLKNLPEGLQPDKNKANHTSETLEPDQ